MSLQINSVKKLIMKKKGRFSKNLLKWSEKNSPDYLWRKTNDPYRIMVSEMLLRRTRASSVEKVYKNFLNKFPTVKTLAKSSTGEIEKVIKSLGIRTRSNKIKSTAEKLFHNYPTGFPTDEKEMLEVFGSGSKYTINAIRCFAQNQKVPIFDVNVKRIFERVFSIDFGNESHKKKSSWEIVSCVVPDNKVKQYNWALLDLGKSICTVSKPRCEACPLNSICDYYEKKF